MSYLVDHSNELIYLHIKTERMRAKKKSERASEKKKRERAFNHDLYIQTKTNGHILHSSLIKYPLFECILLKGQ